MQGSYAFFIKKTHFFALFLAKRWKYEKKVVLLRSNNVTRPTAHSKNMKYTARIITMALVIASLAACSSGKQNNRKQLAAELVAETQQLIQNDQLNTAKQLIDSLHATYPNCVDARRRAAALKDSIDYIEAGRSLQYADSLLAILLPQRDAATRTFRSEKNDAYEDHTRFVHRTLSTDNNTARCFLQAYVFDNCNPEVKSYYYGAGALSQSSIELSAGEEITAQLTGSSHSFEADGYHSILTLGTSSSLDLLRFVADNQSARIRVNLLGTNKNGASTNYVYYLNDVEKKALQATYEFCILLNDIRQLEQLKNASASVVIRYEAKHQN